MRLYADIDFDNGDIIEYANRYVHNRRDRVMIIEWLCDQYSQEAIAERHNMSLSQTKRILTRERERIFRKMKLI